MNEINKTINRSQNTQIKVCLAERQHLYNFVTASQSCDIMGLKKNLLSRIYKQMSPRPLIVMIHKYIQRGIYQIK